MIIENHPWIGKVLWRKIPNTNHKGFVGFIQDVYIIGMYTYIRYSFQKRTKAIKFNESEYEV